MNLPLSSNYRKFRTQLSLLLTVLLICHPAAPDNIPRCNGRLYKPKPESFRAGVPSLDLIYDLDSVTIPEKFDSRTQWPYCKSLRTIFFQGNCGGCWAFASASAMSDRLCIATNGTFNRLLSVQDLLECCVNCVGEEFLGGCEGGWLDKAYLFWMTEGLVTGEQGCKPLYDGTPRGIPQKECRSTCQERYNVSYSDDKRFSVTTVFATNQTLLDLRHIQAEIMLHGPVTGSITTYNYFYSVLPTTILAYDKDLFRDQVEGEGHAIKIIGWDVMEGVPVWIFANSWGSEWGDNGFGYIRRGRNDFGLETEYNIVSGRTINDNQLFGTTKRVANTEETPSTPPLLHSGREVSSGRWFSSMVVRALMIQGVCSVLDCNKCIFG